MRISPRPFTPSNSVEATQNGQQFVPFGVQVRARIADIERILSVARFPPNSPERQALQNELRVLQRAIKSDNAVQVVRDRVAEISNTLAVIRVPEGSPLRRALELEQASLNNLLGPAPGRG